MAHAVELAIVFAIQLFIIVDPLASIPVFIAITHHKDRHERRVIARRSCIIACVVIMFFIAAGPRVLGYFGIGMSAVRVGGGILLFVIALELIYGRITRSEITSREEKLAEAKQDVSVTPLAIPLLAGPGAIATSTIFSGRAETVLDLVGLAAGAAAVFAATYTFLHYAELLYKAVGVLGMTVFMRIMGLLLAFIAVQYVIDGLATMTLA